METGFLNFHDGEHFNDFSLSLDHQHNLLGEPQSSLTQIVDTDFDYTQRLGFDSTDTLWETEQELNGDLAVLPVSGVSGVIPKMENIKEDFAKVLTDWQEHIGFLQATEIEEDIDMVNLDMDLNINADLVDNTPETSSKPKAKVFSPVKLEKPARVSVDLPAKAKSSRYTRKRFSESDQSEKEIDVVGLDSVEEVNSDFDFMHVRRRHVTGPSKAYNCKLLGNNIIKIKQEVVRDIKEDSTENEDETPQVDLSLVKMECTRSNKKKSVKKHKEVLTNKKRRRSVKDTGESVAKVSKKSKKQLKIEKSVEETSNSNNVPLSPKKTPVLEAGDVKSLLEQFEATEAAAQLSASPVPETMEIPTKKPRAKPIVNKSQVTLLKKTVDSQDSRLHKDIRDSLPKEVIDRIKASGRKKMISVIPAIPNTKTGARSNGTRMQEAAATLSRNKLLKLVTNNTSNTSGRADGSVQLDHDYCSNSNSAMSSSSSISSCDSNSEYDRRMSDSEPQTPIKEVTYKNKTDSMDKGSFKTGNKLAAGGTHKNNWSDSNSKKDSGLESGDVSDASEEQQQQQQQQQPLSTTPIKSPTQDSSTNTGNRKSLLANKAATQPKPVYEMKIQSALATSILQLRNGVLTKTKSLESGMKPKQQMVSVLKKPPMATTPQKVLGANLKESIVTTTNSSNDQVQNIIVQDTADVELPEETAKKPPRRKLNLAEYRSRREQNRSDGSRTSSPVQPMVLVYIHHVSTNTEPINGDSENRMWSEREIVSVLKPKAEVEEEKVRPKPATRDRGMQTMETVFGIVYEEQEEDEEEAMQPAPAEEVPQTQSVAQTQTQTEPQEEMEKEPAEEGEVQEDAVQTVDDHQDVVASANNVKALVAAENVNQDAVEEGEVPESGEIVNDDIAIVEETNKAVACVNTISDKEGDAATKAADGEEKAPQTTSINRVRDRRHRNYRRARSSSSSSRSRSRSRSRGRTSRRSRSRSRSRTRSRSRVRSRSRSRSRSRGKARSSRSRSPSPSSGSSRSRSHSRSRRQRNPRRRRRISHRRSSVSSTSSWYSRSTSRSRYRSSSSRSRSRSSRSRSRSSRYSSCSRSSSRSNFGRSKWSSGRRKEKRNRRRSYSRNRRYSSGSSHGYNDWRRSPLPYRRPYDEWYMKEKQRQVEERRVIYVGRLKEGITKAELRRRFEVFGPVVDISIHFRERGHNYGFVTFAYKNDAYEAVEHGNDDPSLPRYDLCFGGRRAFCKVKYADLDGAASNVNGRNMYKPEEENTFDLLLKEAQAKLRKRKV